MIGLVYIDDDLVGEVDLSITDGSMGAIGGELRALERYSKYRQSIQKECERRGIANSMNFNFRISINGEIIKPEGGIGITDVAGFEPYVELAGLDLNSISF